MCTIYLKPYDEDFDETESEMNDFGVKVVMHEYVHCLQHGLVSGDADPAVRYDDIEVIVENPCGIPDVYVEKTKDAFVALPDAFRLVRKVVVFLPAAAKSTRRATSRPWCTARDVPGCPP